MVGKKHVIRTELVDREKLPFKFKFEDFEGKEGAGVDKYVFYYKDKNNKTKLQVRFGGIKESSKPYLLLADFSDDSEEIQFHPIVYLMATDARAFMLKLIGEEEKNSSHSESETVELNWALKFEKAHIFNNTGYSLADSLAINPFEIKVDGTLLGDFLTRQKQSVALLRRQGYATLTLEVPIDHSFIAGFSNGSVHSATIATHPVLGLPYLPGSGVKGAFRAFVEQHLGDLSLYNSQNGGSILGGPKNDNEASLKPSELVFLDAFPINDCMIKADILTNHYSAWYQSGGNVNEAKDAPGDWQAPVPVEFPSLQQKDNQPIKFRFNLLYRLNEQDSNSDELNQKLATLRRHFLFMVALGGFGAKTSSGYGIASTIAASEEGHRAYPHFDLPEFEAESSNQSK